MNGWIASLALGTLIWSGPANADVCQFAGETLLTTGTAILAAPTLIQSWFGVAAVEHIGGAYILSSVGVGGTGYLAGTMGTIVATALGVASSPAVIAAAAGTVIVGAGTGVYCYFAE